MFKLLRKLNVDNFNTDEVRRLLDSHFHPELGGNVTTVLANGKELSSEETQEYWATGFKRRVPRTRRKRLYYFSVNTRGYGEQNLIGAICLKYVWPEFFKIYKKGAILVYELDERWNSSIYEGQVTYAEQISYQRADYDGSMPQGMSGLQADNFPFNVMQIAAYGIYPLILFDFSYIWDLVFVYIPDHSIKYSPMTEGGSYADILWHLHHVYDDQWTFDSSRGPKSKASPRIKPTSNIVYFEWVISQINDRMHDLLSFSDPLQREQLAMTFSRAVFDCVLSVSSQLPYMSKTCTAPLKLDSF